MCILSLNFLLGRGLRPAPLLLSPPHPLSACIDHIVPVAKGGHPSDRENLQLAHWCCNRQKSDKLFMVTNVVENETEISNRDLPQSMDWAAYRAE